MLVAITEQCGHSLYNLIGFAMVLSVAPIPSSTMPSPMPMVTPNTSSEGCLAKYVHIHMYTLVAYIICNNSYVAPTPTPTVPPPVPTATLDTLPDGPLGM